MKVIVAYLAHPYEAKAPAVDSRPKSIERISTSVEDLRNFLHNLHSSKKDGVEARYLSGRTLHSISDRAEKMDEKHRIPDVFEYLDEKLKKEEPCANVYIRIRGRLGEYYYGFQIRNLH